MKPREEGGVVDSKLNVYGVEGLKVAGAYLLRAYDVIPQWLFPMFRSFHRPR